PPLPPPPPAGEPLVAAGTADAYPAGGEVVKPRRRLRNWQLIVLTLVAAGFLVVAYVLGRDSGSKTSDFATFTDDKTGISIDYPKGWRVIEATDAALRFVATPGGDDSASVRVSDVGFTVSPTVPVEVADAKTLTEQLLADKGLTLIRQEDIEINGAATFYYLYSFKDSETGEEGVHAHYFVFHGQQMTQMVFQALPTAGFEKLVPVFARMASSFTPPEVPKSAGSPTTTAGSSPSTPASTGPSSTGPSSTGSSSTGPSSTAPEGSSSTTAAPPVTTP
ncbi:MAG: PsbP-related protein, partial [Acidimicrobiales bacterium]